MACNKKKNKICPCGSRRLFSKCCEPDLHMLGLGSVFRTSEVLFLDWIEKYGRATSRSFIRKTRTYVFRASCYIDGVIDQYFGLGCCVKCSDKEAADKSVFFIEHNMLLSIFAAFVCMTQGLFLQSGILLRSFCEDCLVLLDLFTNDGQLEKFLGSKYSTTNLLSRVKNLIPHDVVEWYGYLTANFTHFGPFHPAPYMPRACYPDNYVLTIGMRNIVHGIITLHLVLERLYFDQTSEPKFWKRANGNEGLTLREDSPVLAWERKLGRELSAQYPLNEPKEGFTYDPSSYRPK